MLSEPDPLSLLACSGTTDEEVYQNESSRRERKIAHVVGGFFFFSDFLSYISLLSLVSLPRTLGFFSRILVHS
jgi:hypothetical protein